VEASYWRIVSSFLAEGRCQYLSDLLVYTANSERAWLFVLSVACCSVYDAESRSNTCQNFNWTTHFNGNNKADYRVLVYKHATSLHFQKRVYVTLFQVVYCVVTELCFVLSHLLIHHKLKCLYQMLVNIMIFSVLIEKRCELLRLYSVGSGRMT